MAKRFTWTPEEARVIEQHLGEGEIRARKDLKKLIPEGGAPDIFSQIHSLRQLIERLERRLASLEEAH